MHPLLCPGMQARFSWLPAGLENAVCVCACVCVSMCVFCHDHDQHWKRAVTGASWPLWGWSTWLMSLHTPDIAPLAPRLFLASPGTGAGARHRLIPAERRHSGTR